MTVSGAGTFNINDTTGVANNYTGTTNIMGGSNVVLGAAEQLPDTSALTINGSTLTRASGATETVGALSMTNGTVNGAGTLKLTNNPTLTGTNVITGGTLNLNVTGATRTLTTVSGGDSVTIADAISAGTGSILKLAGPGSVTLATGASVGFETDVTAGSLNTNAAGIFTGNPNIKVDTGAAWYLNGNNETINMLGSTVAQGGTVNLGGATLTLGAANQSSDNVTFSGVIAGTGASNLIKTGASTVTLSGANTYAGTTTIGGTGIMMLTNTSGSALGSGNAALNGGRLTGTGSMAGNLALNNGTLGGTLTVGGSVTGSALNSHTISPGDTSVGTLHTGTVTFSDFTTIDFSNIISPTNMDKLIVTGSIEQLDTGESEATILVPGVGQLFAGTYTLIQYSTPSASVVDTSAFYLVAGGTPNPQGYALSLDNVADTLTLTMTPNIWQGADNGNWRTIGNWTYGSYPSANGTMAYFTTAGGSHVNLDNIVRLGTLVFDGSGSYNISSSAGNSLTMNNVSGVSQIVLSAAAGTETISAPILLQTTNLVISNNSPNPFTISGPINGGSLAITVSGSGTTILSNSGNTNIGSTTLLSGLLQLGASNALPGAVTITAGALDIQGNTDTVSTLTLSSGSVLGSGGTLTMSVSGALQSGYVFGTLSSTGGIAKTTTGTVVLAAANVVSSTTPLIISAGVLDTQTNNQTLASLTLTGGTLAGSSSHVNIGTGASVTGSGTISANLIGTGGVTMNAAGNTLILSAPTRTPAPPPSPPGRSRRAPSTACRPVPRW